MASARIAALLFAVLVAVACGDISPKATGKSDHAAAASAADAASTSGASPIVTAIRTASDARYHIEQRGFSEVANMGQDASGRWTATAVLHAAPVNVAIAPDGTVEVVEPNAK